MIRNENLTLLNTRLFYDPSTNQIIPLPEIVYDMNECIINRLLSDISLDELSILRCCLPNFLYQLYRQIPNLPARDVVDWIIEGIRTSNKFK